MKKNGSESRVEWFFWILTFSYRVRAQRVARFNLVL